MGISKDDNYKESDLQVPLEQIGDYIKSEQDFHVLELASGHGANSTYLAKKYPNVSFSAMDYSTKPSRKFYNLNNTDFKFGDYHNLNEYPEDHFDIVFIIEALCHARDTTKVIQEVKRVLKPNGYFIIFDGYAGNSFNNLDEYEKKALALTATSMAVSSFQNIDKFTALISLANFKVIEEQNLSQKVIPTMKNFEKKAGKFLNMGFRAKLLKRLLPEMVMRNVIAAYLMPSLCHEQVTVYYKYILQK